MAHRKLILRSAADAFAVGLAWRFIEDGEGYGIYGADGEFLPVHYDEEGLPDGWEYDPPADKEH